MDSEYVFLADKFSISTEFAEKYMLEENYILGENVLTTCLRVPDSEVPDGLHKYETRMDDYGNEIFYSIEKKVLVNFGATVLSKREFDLGKENQIILGFDPDIEYNHCGCDVETEKKKHKVVYNACYGGFGLSKEAEDWLKEKGFDFDKLSRHDPLLVECVETLGDKANDVFSDLQIAEISSRIYRIDEYDGWERVMTPDDDEWTVIE